MNFYFLKRCTIGLLLLLSIQHCFSQGWKKTYGGASFEGLYEIKQTIDGGYVMAGNSQSYSSTDQAYVVKIDPNGTMQWSKTYFGLAARSINQTADGGYIIANEITNNNSFSDIQLLKTDAFGDTLWTKTFGGSTHDVCKYVERTNDGGYFLFGESQNFSNSAYDFYAIKVDSIGNTLWTKTFSKINGWVNSWETGETAQETTDGGFILAGESKQYDGCAWSDEDVWVIRLDAHGDTLWTKTYGGNGDDFPSEIKQTNDGGFIIIGITDTIGSTAKDGWILRLDPNGNKLWERTFGDPNTTDFGRGIRTLPNGDFIISAELGTTPPPSSFTLDAALIRIDSNGQTLWTKRYEGAGSEGGAKVETTTDGGFILGCRSTSYGAGFYDFWVLKTDSLGSVYSGILEGYVQQDNNSNCIYNPSVDIPRQGLIVKAESSSGSIFYSTTDSLGYYTTEIDTGTYTISITSPTPYHQYSCHPSTSTVNYSSFYQTHTVDFLLSPLFVCPLLNVDISAPLIRQTGGGSDYTVHYCNTGTAMANNALVEITLDSHLIVLSTSIPVANQQGNVYSFNVGNIDLNQCNSFSINVIADTTITAGHTLCTEAHIYPDSICIPNYWNGPHLQVSGQCITDTVHFTIKNIGTLLSQSTPYYVYEDNIMLRTGTINTLANNATQIISEPSLPGRIYRLEAKQVPGFPPLLGDSIASATLAGCVPLPGGGWNTNFITQFSNGNSSPFTAIDCQPLVTSYDPNDKSAQPTGYGNQHYIYDYTPLDYKVRFQNTGTDTAFLVVIRDTLSSHLDPASLVMGASSHPYTWRIYGHNILEVTFANILLPDSSTNELASNGFFRFRIEQQPNNPIGTVINNSAAIYFDYNPPIITNQTFHTIGENFVTIQLLDIPNITDDNSIEVKVYPNPFKGQTTIELAQTPYQNLELNIYDLTGKLILQQQSNDHKIIVTAASLPQGLYFYELKGDGERFHTGRLIAQ